MKSTTLLIICLHFFLNMQCLAKEKVKNLQEEKANKTITEKTGNAISETTETGKLITGAEQTQQYLSQLKGKRIGLCVNQTSMVNQTHLVDTLNSLGIDIKIIFAPEHGFRGTADAGETIRDGKDMNTGIKIISLYGNKKKPTKEEMDMIDILIFDIQDVGVRFYTYISTLHYLMESAVENDKTIMVLDRPNPNGFYVDGFVLDLQFSSFVGVDKIPIVHGLTVGEYATMINGESWLGLNKRAKLIVIPCANYTHETRYSLPVNPSPNLRDSIAVYLYPSLCFFEGTQVSIGRGTSSPFKIFGSPGLDKKFEFSFTPKSTVGAKDPPFKDKLCYGEDLSNINIFETKSPFTLSHLIKMYNAYPDKKSFFLSGFFIDKLAGTDRLRLMIEAGKSEDEIRKTWKSELDSYKLIRKKYLLYKDFE